MALGEEGVLTGRWTGLHADCTNDESINQYKEKYPQLDPDTMRRGEIRNSTDIYALGWLLEKNWSTADDDDGFFSDPEVVMGLGVWLILLTVLILITLIIIYIKLKRDHKERKDPGFTLRIPRGVIPEEEVAAHAQPAADTSWMSDMREKDIKVLPVETINDQRRARQNGTNSRSGTGGRTAAASNGYVFYKVG